MSQQARQGTICLPTEPATILMSMPDDIASPHGAVFGGRATGKSHAVAEWLGYVQDAVQEMHDSSRADLELLSSRLVVYWEAKTTAVPLPAETVAAEAEKAGLSAVAKLVRAGAKFGIASIIAAIISGPIVNEEGNLLHWTPPPISVVQAMSPQQMEELTRQIVQQVEQQIEKDEHQGDHRDHSAPPQPALSHRRPPPSAQPPP
jgi:hypothetical protein